MENNTRENKNKAHRPTPSSSRGPRRTAVYGAVPPYHATPPYGPVYGTPYGGDPSESPGWLGDLSPKRLLGVARRKWLTIVLTTLFILGGAAFYLYMAPRIYLGEAIIEMSVRRPRIMRQEGGVIEDAPSWRTDEVFNTRIQRFHGEPMRALAFAHLEWDGPRGEAPEGPDTMPDAVFALKRQSNLVTIRVHDRNRALAAAVANAYAHAAEELMVRENRDSSEQAVAWLQTQAAAQRHAIDRADQALVEFRSNVRLDTLESRAAVARETLLSAGEALAEVENRRLSTQELRAALDSAALTPESIERIPRETPFAATIVAAHERVANARAERDALAARFTPQHPDYIAAEETVAFARGQVVAALRQARETVEADARLLNQQATSLSRRVDTLGDEASRLEIEIAQARAQLASHDREREAADMSYRGLLNRIEEARLSADEYTAAVSIVNLAELPERPVSPRPRRALALALLFGLGLGGGLALLKDGLEDTLQHDEDVEQTLGIKVLSVIPTLKRMGRGQVAQMCHENKNSHFAEAFAGLRSLLDPGKDGVREQVILVTSTMPGVGKTICSTNLAICFAQRGERTLLIDFDMRRPQLRRIFGMPPDHESLLHVLADRDTSRFPALAFSSAIPNLDIVCSRRGHQEHSAAEVIGQSFVATFIEWARESYDRVILDSPPFGIVSDAVVLAKYADGGLMVFRPGTTRKGPARSAIQHLDEVGSPILGAVINALDFRRAAFGSSYSYYYSHERYGYGDHYKTPGDETAES